MSSTGDRVPAPPAPSGRVRILFFATARTAVGARSISWPVPTSGRTLREVLSEVVVAHPHLGPLLPHCRFFRNEEAVARPDELLRPGEELAIHPPYGGG
jgi:molybdopterin converting factor small subunit